MDIALDQSARDVCPSRPLINAHLDDLVGSHFFKASERLRTLLRFLVSSALERPETRVTQHVLARDVFGLGETFDPQENALVRVEMGKLRTALKLYYADKGRDDSVRIEIPLGRYLPSFRVFDTPSDSVSFAGRTSGPVRANSAPKIAVLPFAALGRDPEDAHIAEEVTDQLVTMLSHIPELRVLSRLATTRFSESRDSALTLARQLDARYVLHGRLRREGNHLRVCSQLSDARTGYQMWADQYHRVFVNGDLFSVEDDIVRRIIASTGDMMVGAIRRNESQENGAPRQWEDPVWRAKVRYFTYLENLTSATYETARRALEAAVVASPEDAVLLAMLGDLARAGDAHGFRKEPGATEKALEWGEAALALSPQSVTSRIVVCLALLRLRETERLSENLEPFERNEMFAPSQLADAAMISSFAGNWDDGCATLSEKLRVLPSYPTYYHYPLLLNAYRVGNYEQAAHWAGRSGKLESFWQPMLTAAAMGQLGCAEKAKPAVDSLLDQRPDFPDNAHRYLSAFIVDDALIDHLTEGLRKAGMPRPACQAS